MAMSQMGANCSMPQRAAGSGCLQECCRFGPQQAIARSADTSKPKSRVAETQLFRDLPLPQVAPAGFLVAQSAIAPGASPPPRYILFRVFRI